MGTPPYLAHGKISDVPVPDVRRKVPNDADGGFRRAHAADSVHCMRWAAFRPRGRVFSQILSDRAPQTRGGSAAASVLVTNDLCTFKLFVAFDLVRGRGRLRSRIF